MGKSKNCQMQVKYKEVFVRNLLLWYRRDSDASEKVQNCYWKILQRCGIEKNCIMFTRNAAQSPVLNMYDFYRPYFCDGYGNFNK